MGLAQPQLSPSAQPPALTQLLRLVPLGQLDNDRLQELRKHLVIETRPAGTCLFTRGQSNNQVMYLLDGEVDYIVNQARTMITAKAPQARQPLDPHEPRHFTAITRTAVQIIQIERKLLDLFVAQQQRNGYLVKEIAAQQIVGNDGNWMETILQSAVFQKIPPINIQVMFAKFNQQNVRKDEIIFRQDQDGDYYYLIKSGNCAVLRKENNDEGWRFIAELGPGQVFGEEALLTDKPRNATIQMTSDGTLLRLARQDFNQLLKTPVVKTVNYQNALELIRSGAIWLDVRDQDERQAVSLPESLHVPLSVLREYLTVFTKDHPMIVYCDNTQRSACAAYLLNAQGFEAIVLEGGTDALHDTP
jgi:CRP-like cAMP-binding protein